MNCKWCLDLDFPVVNNIANCSCTHNLFLGGRAVNKVVVVIHYIHVLISVSLLTETLIGWREKLLL